MDIKYIAFNPEAFQNKRTAVIDGDGFAWAIGWINKDAMSNKQVTDSVDSCIHDILQGVRAEHYIGVLSPNSEVIEIDPDYPAHGAYSDKIVRPARPNFRKAIAKSRPYKGNRPERPEWYLKWCPIIENHLEEAWGFIRTPEGYEADDLVATLMSELTSVGAKPICCGNDKDLLQIPGEHFNVVKKTMQTLDQYQCAFKLWTQCLMGDSTDGIEGIPGMGPKGAENILGNIKLSEGNLKDAYRLAVSWAYINKFGEDIGIQKFYENYMLVKLRTDVSTDEFDLKEICRGYDLVTNEIQFTEERPEEQTEQIPDFSINTEENE